MRKAAFASAVAIVGASVLGCTSGNTDGEPTAVTDQPIVGGYVDEETKGAVGLALNLLDVYFTGHCSGSLLTPNLVLTAQHCVALTKDETPSGGVICGQTDFGTMAGGAVMRVTTETVRPDADGPAFHKGEWLPVRVPPETTNLCGFDVALIILEGAGIPAAEATPLVPRIDSSPDQDGVYSAIGYGLTSPDNGSSGTRMRIDDNIVSCLGEDCGSSVWASEWRGDSPTCPGDSGGPALDEQGRVMGVLSRGPSGCINSVYGDVAAWKDFIIETALEAAELGGIEPPFWALTGESTPPPPAGAGEPCLGVCVEGSTCAMVDTQRICVPVCDPADELCPGGHTCDPVRGACIPEPAPPAVIAPGEEDSGCAVGAGSRPTRPGTWALLWVWAMWLARRRWRP